MSWGYDGVYRPREKASTRRRRALIRRLSARKVPVDNVTKKCEDLKHMSVDVIEFVKKTRDEYEHIDSVRDAFDVLIEALKKEADQDYLGELYRTDYSVTGRGAFPVDMLRYTCSWPFDENDTKQIEDSLELADADDAFTVRLTKYHRDPKPTLAEDRWTSKFRWKVLGQSVETTRL